MTDAIVIGAGLFGCIIAKHLRSEGMHVTIIDDNREGSGSKPAACLMKPSWFSSLGSEYYTPALDMLDQLYGLQDIQFGIVKVKWIPPSKILTGPDIVGKVTKIVRDWRGWLVHTEDDAIPAKIVIIAAGIWCNEILRKTELRTAVPGLATRQGVAFITPNYEVPKPFIKPWAPYKQIVAFNREPGMGWISDGTALKQLTLGRILMCKERCQKVLSNDEIIFESIMGNRPYTPQAKPCYIEEHTDGLWVVTGGAKNGTIAAGYAAYKLGRILG